MSLMAQVEMVRAACCVASLDGEICGKESKLIAKLADRVGIGGASLKAMIDRARKDPHFYEQQFRTLKGDAKTTMKTLFAVAIVDGKLTQEERIILHHFAEKLGLPDDQFNRILEAAETMINAPSRGGQEND